MRYEDEFPTEKMKKNVSGLQCSLNIINRTIHTLSDSLPDSCNIESK